MDTIKWNKTPFYRLMAAMVLGAGTAIAPLVLLMFGLIQFKMMSVVGPEATTNAFGLASGIASLAIVVLTPLGGMIADKTHVKMGRRRFWIVAGSIGGFIFMMALAYAQSMAAVVASWCIAQFFYGMVSLSCFAMIPAQVDEVRFGRASGIMSSAAPIFVMSGSIIIGIYAATPVELKIAVVSAVQLLAGIVTALLVKDTYIPAGQRQAQNGAVNPFKAGLRNFYPSFKKYPAYTWALLTKLFINFSNAGLTMLTLFYVARFHLSEAEVFEIGSYTGASILLMVLAGLCGGWLSDKFRRQKPFVMGASLITGVCLVIFAAATDLWTVIAGYFVFNFGYGLYNAVDNALVNRILPSKENAGKDIAIMNITTNLASSLVNFVAPLLIAVGVNLLGDDGYTFFFMLLSVCSIISFLAVIPIPEVNAEKKEAEVQAAPVKA
ncbi:MAG: MFS transporter [Selenomonas sp.]|nr:MFS transporter [Selenomonas sp.]